MLNNYLIESEDYLSREEKVKEIIKTTKFDDTLINRYDVSEVSIENALEDLCTYGLFSTKKIVIIDNFDKINYEEDANLIKSLFKYLEQDVKDNLLIITGTKFDDRKKIIKDLKKKTNYIKIDIDPINFIKDNLKDYKLEYGVVNLINLNTAGDISRIYNECMKLKDYKYKDKYISKDDVKILGIKKFDNETGIIFDFVKELALKNKKEALLLYQELLNYQVEPLSIIGLLASQFRIIYQVKVLEEKGYKNDEIAEMLKEKPYRITKTRELSRYYSKNEILKIIRQIHEIDYRLKTSDVDGKKLIELFIFNM